MENQGNIQELEKEKKNESKKKSEKKEVKKKIPKEKLSPAERKAKLIERYKLQCKKLNEEEKKDLKKRNKNKRKNFLISSIFLKKIILLIF